MSTFIIVSRAAVAHVKERMKEKSKDFRTTVHFFFLSGSSGTKAVFVVAGFTMDKATGCLPTAV